MRRVALGFLIAGAALVVLGIAAAVDRYTGSERRVREGVPVVAVVEWVGTWGSAKTGGAWVQVRYQIDGVTHRVGLGSTSGDAGVAKGETITVYVDRDDPESVVTGTGLVSDYRHELLPPVMVTVGVVVMGIAGPRLRRRAPAVPFPAAEAAVAARPEPPLEFCYAMPGYRADIVDRLLNRVHRAIHDDPEGSGRTAAIAALRRAELPTAPRGYRQDQVDLYLRQLLAELGQM
ncbi:DivIVA domain-containing protein [Dactylosporangium sp. McL0621]|uniref:DivIVA domain-containing protein n=1 Tax=Dactylosporangium sp. McL0621 TaxID=3415678 RepID=UPI003CE80325